MTGRVEACNSPLGILNAAICAKHWLLVVTVPGVQESSTGSVFFFFFGIKVDGDEWEM